MSGTPPPTPPGDLGIVVFDPMSPLPSGRLLIEASAGTGKTYTVSTLAVRFVAEVDGVGAAGLCVVSFTEAATSELRSRIRERMVEVADALVSGAETGDELVIAYRKRPVEEQRILAERLRRATEEFDRALITTIHGFCSRVLGALGASVGAVGSGGDEVAEVVNDLLLTTARPLAGPVTDSGDASGDPPVWPEGVPPLSPSKFRQAVDALVQLPLATMDGATRPTADPAAPPAVPPTGPPDSEDDLRCRVAEAAQLARDLVARRRQMSTTRSFDSLLTDVRNLLDPAAGATDATRAAVRNALGAVRVVMVDEFQDTDGLQWAIFDNAFPADTCPMVLVGDPKQSIYRFRSAELSAYLTARSGDGVAVATLGTNYRSDPGVLDGIERLYVSSVDETPYALGSDVTAQPAVHFRPVRAHHTGRRLEGMDLPQSVELRVLDPGAVDGDEAGGAATLPVGLRRAWVTDDVARQVSRLLRVTDPRDGASGEHTAVRIQEADGTWRDLRPSDIAVLVTTNSQALGVAHRLGRSGIAAATATTNSVLDGAAAWQWRLLLAALARPASPGPVRAAALGWFIGLPASVLADPEADLAEIHERLASWASVLRRGGPIALLAEARRGGLADRLLAQLGGERRITDLEHIAELLQRAVGSRPAGALEVTDALDELSSGASTADASDQMARRIDRDDDAVQVLTVHRAKGLEFPIVLCPYLWVSRRMDGVPHAAVPLVGDDGAVVGVERRVWTPWIYGGKSNAKQLGAFNLGSTVSRGGQKVPTRFKLEHLEEADRVTYVALTRAAAHLVVWWASPAAKGGRGGKDQALARLLAHASGRSTSELVAAPATVRSLAGPAIAVELVDVDAPELPRATRRGSDDLARATYTRGADQPWQRWSYSRLSEQLVAGVVAVGDAASGPAVVRDVAVDVDVDVDPDRDRTGGADERPVAGAVEPAVEGAVDGVVPSVQRAPDPFAGLGGTRFGTMVHSVLEQVDFTSADLVGDLEYLLADAMAHWRSASRAPAVAAGLAAALAAPLGGPLRSVDTRLVALPADHRLNELRFDLALGPTTVGDLADVLSGDPAVTEPFGVWLDRLRGGPTVEGMLTGSIDLVASFDGQQYWVADHKTNLLPDGYGSAQLVTAMAHHDYPLQATLYLVALHRFLAQRLAGYDPERHLAGAAYLFVRGMASDASGIYWFTPAPQTVVAASDLLADGVTSWP